MALDAAREMGAEAEVVREAVSTVLNDVAKRRPELQFPSPVP
ncbi:hypothetical protein AHiyo1_37010 [Arthrobacter sp. Hiyo1]|nr:hypothetical protein AHiyo1_37010 [Arthrobacter sp. Hiyo1]